MSTRHGKPASAAPSSPLARALAPHRARLVADALAFTHATLALANTPVDASAPHNQPTPQITALLAVIAGWRRDLQATKSSVVRVSAAPGAKLAEEWLTKLANALGYAAQSLTLTDAAKATTAGNTARERLAQAARLEASLDKVIR